MKIRADSEAEGHLPSEGSADAGFVRVERLSKRFGEVVALEDASLNIRRGEILTLLGPSGGGKTTLLNLIAGFVVPDSGSISIEGRLVTDVPTHRREIGVLFQNYALFPHMNVAANVAYGLKTRNMRKAVIRDRVAEVLGLVRLSGYETRKPRQLSGGQQQRVALARALAISPKVLLLDEPFSALDKNLRASMQLELKEIQRKLGVTTIFVTHDQSEALRLSDRIAVLSEGRIHQVGTPDAIYRRPADRFVARFVGDVNVFRATLERVDTAAAIVAVGATRLAVPAEPLRGLSPGRSIELFVRPEQLRLTTRGEASLCDGVIAAHAYQGGHIDIYVATDAALSGRILIRQMQSDAAPPWPVGAECAIACTGNNAVAFPVG
ncbi:MAG: putative spermidine/putrescine transport system ATP-binding protein [Methylobacteriaceae bacterium]|nr:putative spermidine/putrescine transport system ATP-binding protein [Methylobacteriaceae bacterium]